MPGGAAGSDGRLRPGDEITYIDSICVIGASHHKVVQLMGQSSSIGHVTLRVRRKSQFGTGMLYLGLLILRNIFLGAGMFLDFYSLKKFFHINFKSVLFGGRCV